MDFPLLCTVIAFVWLSEDSEYLKNWQGKPAKHHLESRDPLYGKGTMTALDHGICWSCLRPHSPEIAGLIQWWSDLWRAQAGMAAAEMIFCGAGVISFRLPSTFWLVSIGLDTWVWQPGDVNKNGLYPHHSHRSIWEFMLSVSAVLDSVEL